MDNVPRSWTKAVCWQLMGLACMVLVGLFFTGSWSLGGQMAFANAALGLVMYYGYERVWSRISWGRVPLDQRRQDA